MSTPGPHNKTRRAPFTADEVAAIVAWQQSGNVHPYTHTRTFQQGTDAHRTVTLTVSSSGLSCPLCDYTQTWVHDITFDVDPLGRTQPSPLTRVDLVEIMAEKLERKGYGR